MGEYERSYYQRYQHYIRKNDLSDVLLFSKIFTWLEDLQPKKVLDIGCGIGYLTSAVRERTGAQVIGVDFSWAAIDQANELFPATNFLRGEALCIPFPTEAFDVVLVINLIEHFHARDQKKLMLEITRVLKKEGTIILSTPDPRSLYAQIVVRDFTHKHELPREELFQLMGKYLTIEEMVYTNSIGRFHHKINKLLSNLLPADILVRAKNQPSQSIDYLSEFLRIYPSAHALARACEAKAFSTVYLEEPILDLGCGDGSFMEVLLNGRRIHVGTDIDMEAIRKTIYGTAYKSSLVCDVANLPFSSKSFSSVISNSVFEHLDSPSIAIQEIARILIDHGVLLFTVPNHRTREWWINWKIWRWLKDRLWKHKNLMSASWWKDELRKFGFENTRVLEFANQELIQVLDYLFLPAALWFLVKRIGFPLPSLGKYWVIRSLMIRILESRYWKNDNGPGASYLFEATKA